LTGCFRPADQVDPAVEVAARRALAAVSEAVGIDRPELRFMTQVRFHAPFRRIGDDLWRAGIDDGESVAGMADRDNGVIWVSTSGAEDVAGVVAHEVAHMAGAGEEAALWYQAEFEAGRLPDR